MGESNGEWGELAAASTELADKWDGYATLPDPGANEALDAFCERKRLTIPALVRLGARLVPVETGTANATVLAFAFDLGLKYRDLATDRRWATHDAEWRALKIVRAAPDPAPDVIVAEGETDAARLTMLYPACDVAILPAGAGRWIQAFADQLIGYGRVLVGTDNDKAGDAGAQKIIETLPNAVRFRPTGADWGEADKPEPLPDAPTQMPNIVFAGDLLNLEVPEVASWFEHALLPIGGSLLIHGWAKNYKSWLALDLMAAVAVAQDWACFGPTEEPARACVIQWEIPWPYYHERIQILRDRSDEPRMFDQHFGTWQPLRRPTLAAGNVKQEDAILGPLVDAGIQVVLIDPVRRAAGGGDLNSEQDARKLLHFFERMQREGIAVIYVHHDNKAASRSRYGDMANATGSGAWVGDADSIVSVSVPPGEDQRSNRRNLRFEIRNGSPVGDRGFMLQEDATIVYATESFSDGADTENEPVI